MSVTRVPIRPVQKGSLTKLWIGVAALALVAGGMTWAGLPSEAASPEGYMAANAGNDGVVTTESGLQILELAKGTGPSPAATDVVLIGYEGRLTDDTMFDSNERAPMPVSGSIPGFSEALQRMQKGGKYRIWIPPALGYGDQDVPNPQTGEVVIPANSVLIFDVELLEFKTAAELEAMRQQMQQPGSVPPPPGQ